MHTETVILEGHIIDSLILAKVLDTILQLGGSFDLREVHIGATREEPSRARIRIQADSSELLGKILQAIQPHGALVEAVRDCTFEPAPADGVLPDAFYATSHLPTQVRLKGQWIEVEAIEMDLAIQVTLDPPRARTIPMAEVKAGDLIVTGREGVRVFPLERPKERDVFAFMEAQVSSERPHHPIIADIARRMRLIRDNREKALLYGGKAVDASLGTKVLVVGGPAIVHAGGREALAWLIDSGFVHVLFCGNALAAHDMEASLFGTSLGYALHGGHVVPHGHEHHLRTINRVRAMGSIRRAVESGLIRDGIMASCIRHNVEMVLAGSIRDDGPLPDVITDTMKAQTAMRAALPGVGLALMVATTLHSIATGNLLPAKVPTVCVDINPAVPTKLTDRGSFQAVGLVMDSSSFLRQLARELSWQE
ncbi:MAG: TIGR00300 family protein [Nitrospirae bacterium]|nr:MAG: TIGR00300 family protein [Nitrospirota bacterium]